ncbi:pirin family protein [Bacillus sp. DJP31]|uniref:pirin family protein n=1 Tax=Bacillus sp. DJP31 TaxID=3409789 RepID=UPI003BB65A0F
MDIKVYPPDQQGTGAFDGGKITEQKPIGFPGEGSKVVRIGPLFYWAWAKSKEAGFIPSHPHQGFEIITYVVNGRAEHGDSLGTKSTVGPGGIQVMQTGSGVYHQEAFIGPDFDGFQIWFEPYLNEAVLREPKYSQYNHEDFSSNEENNVIVKKVIGGGSPVQLVADVKMWDIKVEQGSSYSHNLGSDRSLAILAIEGNGIVDANHNNISFNEKDFVVANSKDSAQVTIQANSNLRLIMIEVPTHVDYPVYQK